ncbi:MAG: hypothetical protein KatS3mg131_2961 [Candidatus Tectimicrobiota bacterium]|nr:MAG: hypothetical protein KatS3mg131_2961 [Candidatus Tectomicrobia bacterium]
MVRRHVPQRFFCAQKRAYLDPTVSMAHVLRHHQVTAADLGLRPTVIVSLVPPLARRLFRQCGTPAPAALRVLHQPLYNPERAFFSCIASPMGAPMAAMLLEQLIALGGRRFLYLGFCGALQPELRIGDLFLPTRALREEGTSYHYLPPTVEPAAAERLTAVLQAQAHGGGLRLHPGVIWTTDAPYRETRAKIRRFQAAGVAAVDMEMAALFAVARYRQCEVAALLVVSDECYHPVWRPGFGAPSLRQACQQAVALALEAAAAIAALPDPGVDGERRIR